MAKKFGGMMGMYGKAGGGKKKAGGGGGGGGGGSPRMAAGRVRAGKAGGLSRRTLPTAKVAPGARPFTGRGGTNNPAVQGGVSPRTAAAQSRLNIPGGTGAGGEGSSGREAQWRAER